MKTATLPPTQILCSMCGKAFDPEGNRTCLGCPLHENCHLVRCPACGFETVDPRGSHLAKLVARLFKKEI